MGECLGDEVFEVIDFVWENWLEAAGEVHEIVAFFVNLDPLPIIFDLCIHPIGAALECLSH